MSNRYFCSLGSQAPGATLHPTGQSLCPTDISTSSQRLHHGQDFCTPDTKTAVPCHCLWHRLSFLTQKKKLKMKRRYFRQMVPHVSFFSVYSRIFLVHQVPKKKIKIKKKITKNPRKAWVSQSSHHFSQKANITALLLQDLTLGIFCWSKTVNKPFSWLQGHRTVFAQIKSSPIHVGDRHTRSCTIPSLFSRKSWSGSWLQPVAAVLKVATGTLVSDIYGIICLQRILFPHWH